MEGKRKSGMTIGFCMGLLICIVWISVASSFQAWTPRGDISVVDRQFRQDVFDFNLGMLQEINDKATSSYHENDSVEKIASAYTDAIMVVAWEKVEKISSIWSVSSAEIKGKIRERIVAQIKQQKEKGQQFKLASVLDPIEDEIGPVIIHFRVGQVNTRRISNSVKISCPFATTIFVSAIPYDKKVNPFDHWEILDISLKKIKESKGTLLEMSTLKESYVVAYFR